MRSVERRHVDCWLDLRSPLNQAAKITISISNVKLITHCNTNKHIVPVIYMPGESTRRSKCIVRRGFSCLCWI